MKPSGTARKALLAVLILASAPPTMAQTPADIFRKADADTSGGLSRAEFRRFIDLSAEAGRDRAKMVRINNAYDRAFAQLDSDKDGALSRAELRSG